MIKVEHVETYGMESALRGLRNPYDSWEKSDSGWRKDQEGKEMFEIGGEDVDLMHKLYKAGTEHRKFMRQIFVSMDITAPLYWWKQFDTYKVGTTSNSCSTMHTIMKKPFAEEDFSMSAVNHDEKKIVLSMLNSIRYSYIDAGDKEEKKRYWLKLIQLLPESYNQKRTITMNYEVAATIIKQRKGHKLGEWSDFIGELMETLPCMDLIIGAD